MKIYLVGEAATLRYALFPLSELHCYLRRAATAIKKPDIEKKGTLNGYLFFSMPGNLVTHRTMSKDPWLGAISSFILLWVDTV